MREFRIRLRDAAFDGLVDRALRERRAPGEQAAYMLEQVLLREARARPRHQPASHDGSVLTLSRVGGE